MEITIYNPQKGGLETIAAELTTENTTRFENCGESNNVSMNTDIEGDVLIRENGYSYPVMIYGVSRTDIAFNPQKAKRLKKSIRINAADRPANAAA